VKPILEIQNISKKFRIGGDRSGYKTLRDSLFAGRSKKEDKGEFWALQDVSFDVFPGDSIGIIGKNGAGKSTLLKILSRITPPTKGKIICRGRVASLLEVGTGFHGELSGRENIYLNGSILGLKRTEINNKFDEIVDFSGVEKFLDTPLKHYSSGMQLRLAFAVAAHLEPEILIIDEVLAVGDAEFQKKCLGKMDEISKEQGRTILFVSHNLGQVQMLCRKAILLNEGKIQKFDCVSVIVQQYTSLFFENYKKVKNYTENTFFGDNIASLYKIRIVDKNKELFQESPTIKDRIGIEVTYKILK
jgi:lipopolysaccharide transport system ATP-binding protein